VMPVGVRELHVDPNLKIFGLRQPPLGLSIKAISIGSVISKPTLKGSARPRLELPLMPCAAFFPLGSFRTSVAAQHSDDRTSRRSSLSALSRPSTEEVGAAMQLPKRGYSIIDANRAVGTTHPTVASLRTTVSQISNSWTATSYD